jgi:hypothetical protein
MSRLRPSLAPAWLLVAVAFFLFVRPLACKGVAPLVPVPDDGPIYFDSGPDSGPDAGDAGDGGYHSDGGCDINGTIQPNGIWLNLGLGSCTACDPSINPNGWTVLDSGQPCRGFVSATDFGEALSVAVPFAGVCGFQYPFGSCGGARAGGSCDVSRGFGCEGSVCNADGWCEVTQNLGWFTACGWANSIPENACADGPCCGDAGYAGVIPDGGGWCCGLVDGGVPSCLSKGNVCLMDSNCCEALICTSSGGVIPGDAGGGHGTCQEPGP